MIKKRRRTPFAPKSVELPEDTRRVRCFAVDGARAFVLLDDGSCHMATPNNPKWTPGPFPECPWFPKLPEAK